jgi:ribosomal protein S13
MRLLGITLPDNKNVQYGLTAIYGIGLARALAIAAEERLNKLATG